MSARKSLTKNYRGFNMAGGPLWGLVSRTAFDVGAVDFMRLDSQVKLSTAMFTAPLFMGQWIVRAKSPEVAKWLNKQLLTLQKNLGAMIQYLQYGYAGFEILQEDDGDLVGIAGVKDFHPRDARPLTIDDELIGVRVKDASAELLCRRGQALWLAHEPRHGSFFGSSIYQAAFYPWLEKVQRDGADEIRRLWFYKNAFNGDVLRFPVEDIEDIDGVIRSMKDIAQQLVEAKKTGGQWTLPSTKDEHGNYEWDVTFAAMGDAATGILAYGDKLDLYIARGIGLPDDVLSNPDTSSTTYGGRRIGWEAMLTSLFQIHSYILASEVKQVLKPLAKQNFGDEPFNVLAYPLTETIRKSAKQNQPQQGQGQSGMPPNMPGMPGMQQPGGMPQGNGEPQNVQFGFDTEGTSLLAGGFSGTARFSQTEWQAWGFSKHGTPRWHSLRTGRVVYQAEPPGAHEDHDAPSQEEPQPKVLDPHEMTQAQYLEHKAGAQRPAQLKKWHQDHVRNALKGGREVPEHVLADYPSLQRKKAATLPNKEQGGQHGDVEGTGSGAHGLPAGEQLGAHAEEAPGKVVPGTGEGTGERTERLPASDDGQRDGAGRETAGRGDESARGQGAGDGATAAEDAGRRGPAGAVGDRGSDSDGAIADHGSPVERSFREEPAPENPTDVAAGNFRYSTRNFAVGGLKAKYKSNVEAIRTLQLIRAEGRTSATPAEQEVISKFVGWGAFPSIFNSWHDTAWRAEMEKRAGPLDYGKYNAERTQWDKEREELKGLLSDAEWASAKRSTLNAHFTAPDVVDAHWKMAERLGFKGGRFLETSAGIGYYQGLMPAHLASRTRTSAVELDSLTGDMLKLLYPAANVQVQGFEKHLAPNGFYDLVASNVPFGDYKVHDPKYNKHDANIHDYFFLKSADLAAPGGLVMHITSTGTMDKGDSKIREELAKTCDLVSAIRFPSGVHKENAGTEVVTDMLILRKRHPGETPVDPTATPISATPDPKLHFTGISYDSLGRLYHWKDGKRVPGPNWMDVTTVPDPAGGDPIPVNKYFADHPEQILGTLDRTGTMYHAGNVNVSRTDDYDDKLQAAIYALPRDLMKVAVSKGAFKPESLPAPGDVKDGGFKIQDGKLYQREGGALVPQSVKPQDLARVQGQLGVRDAMRATINDQREGKNSTDSLAHLNTVYDAFVAQHGPLNDPANRKAFKGDPDAPNLLALEDYDAKAKTARKSDVFRKDTVRSATRVTKASNVSEGVGVSLHETGSIDIARIAELTGQSPEAVSKELAKTGLAFQDPSEGWKPADQYLSGNVRRKLVMARAAAAADPQFQTNVDALEKVQPEDIEAGTEDGIDVKIGAPWVPPSDIEHFAAHLLGGKADDFTVGYVASDGSWRANYSAQGERRLKSTKAARIWSTDDVDFRAILESALNNKPVTVYLPKDEDGKAKVDVVATQDAAAKMQEIKDAFKEWIWEDDERKTRLHRFYNDNFNNTVKTKWDGSHQAFPGMNPAIKLHPHIHDFVWQVVTTGKGLAAHEVGMGKTWAMVAAAMELRRLGLARKPAIACLKSNIEAITKDALRLYPGARILSTTDMFDAASRTKTMARMATGDYDMVILTHEHLNAMKMKPEIVAGFIKEEISELEEAQAAAIAADPDSKKSRAGKAMEKAKADLEARLQAALNEEAKDDTIFFEDSGIDHLFVDEAHKFKTLPVRTKQGNIKGVPTGRSQRATNMLMRTRWLMDKNGGRGVVFATGTPVTNTMAELYNMQKYLQPKEMKERGVQSFDAWANVFGNVVTKPEFTLTGEYKPVSRFAEFTNLPELQQMTSQFMDVQRVDDLTSGPVPEEAQPKEANFTGLTTDGKRTYEWRDGKRASSIIRPTRQDDVVKAPKSEAIVKLMESLRERADKIKHRKGPPKPGDDNMLVVGMDGKKGALDMRLLDENAPDDPSSKTNMAVSNVLDLHKANPGITQIIFSDLGVHALAKKKAMGGDAEAGEEADAAVEEMKALMAGDAKSKFRLYGDIIDKLVAGGIPRDRIADFSELEGAKKEAAQEAMRRGEIVVALGSTEKLGTGVNVQNKLAHLHQLDCPYVPASIEQRVGRGFRHGNENKTIGIHNYVTEGSLDQLFWQIVGKKAKFIQQVISGNNKNRTVKDDDTVELSPEQVMAEASGDPRIIEKVNLDDEIKNLKAAESRHGREQVRMKKTMEEGTKSLPTLRKAAEGIVQDAKHLADNPEFAFQIGDATYHENDKDARKDAVQALSALAHAADEAERESYRSKPVPMGTYRGMKVVRQDKTFHLEGPSGQMYKVGDSLASIEAHARGLAKKTDEAKRIADKTASDLEMVKGTIGKPFTKSDELKEKQARLKVLERELSGKSGVEEEPKPKTKAMPVEDTSGPGETAEADARAIDDDDQDVESGRRTMKSASKAVEPEADDEPPPYYSVSGNTFAHKDAIKKAAEKAGGRAKWNPDDKAWVIPSDAHQHVSHLKGLKFTPATRMSFRLAFDGEKADILATICFAWEDSKHPRGQPENKGEFAGKDESADKATETWLQHAAKVPAALMAKARTKVKAKYDVLESRYGRAQAIAIVGAGIAGLALPIPGSSFLVAAPLVGLAELYHRLKPSTQMAHDLSDEEIERLGKELREELLKEFSDAAIDLDLYDRVQMALSERLTYQFAAAHAPKGGISIKGKDFAGGEFIPGQYVAAATPAQKAQLVKTGKKVPESKVGAQPAWTTNLN